MTEIIFIGATGTDIGKTYVSCLLLRQLRAAGLKARAIKPVISGFDPQDLENSDTGQLLLAMGKDLSLYTAKEISPWRYQAPLPPHIAAGRENNPIDYDELLRFCRASAVADLDYLVIEGAGGIMTPLSYSHTTLDLMRDLKARCLLVTGSYLGTISHTMTAISCLEQQKVPLAGLVLSESLENYINFDLILEDFTEMLPEIPIKKISRNDQSTGLISLIRLLPGDRHILPK